jgi:hypothetical protein
VVERLGKVKRLGGGLGSYGGSGRLLRGKLIFAVLYKVGGVD